MRAHQIEGAIQLEPTPSFAHNVAGLAWMLYRAGSPEASLILGVVEAAVARRTPGSGVRACLTVPLLLALAAGGETAQRCTRILDMLQDGSQVGRGPYERTAILWWLSAPLWVFLICARV
jgi:hypothetical protein